VISLVEIRTFFIMAIILDHSQDVKRADHMKINDSKIYKWRLNIKRGDIFALMQYCMINA
jgi:hypothetical protein